MRNVIKEFELWSFNEHKFAEKIMKTEVVFVHRFNSTDRILDTLTLRTNVGVQYIAFFGGLFSFKTRF